MEEKISCFKWHNQVSDYLDETLSESLKLKFDEHLEICKDCQETFKHYQIILQTLGNLPQNNMPPFLRKDPLTALLPEVESQEMRISKWDQIPWGIRILLQSLIMVSSVFILVSSAPYIRTFYENFIYKNIEKFKTNLNEQEIQFANKEVLPLLQSKAGSTTTSDEFSDEGLDEEDVPDEKSVKEKITVGNSQLWRFTIRTVSPEEMRVKVIQVLKELKISSSSQNQVSNGESPTGVLVPGGIEFDLVTLKGKVGDIKKSLEKLVPPDSDDFAWYRVESRKKIPNGTSQVVIWLFQPN